MPASDISRISTMGQPKSDLAAAIAKDIAHREIRLRIERGMLRQEDEQGIRREWKDIYRQEYYKYYAMLIQQDQRPEKIIYLPTVNPSATKFFHRHCVAGFNRTNLFVHGRRNDTIIGRVNFPLDEDDSIETKEALLGAWPGPLDRDDEQIKRKTTDYIDTLYQHDPQRKIKYCNSTNDEQRRTILKLLTELLHRNGSIDAPGITRLLLKTEETEIQKDEGNRRPLETLQKYLLLGKRAEAIKYAKTRKLWDHAQCLAFLDKYQPPSTNNYCKDGLRLTEDTIVQLIDEYINSIEPGILNTVYRSLLNRILQSDPESINIVKHPNVENKTYDYAMLSANDCEMEFDRTNEIFKLIQAVKKANQQPGSTMSHLITLGLTTVDSTDPSDDLSYLSNLSFKQTDTPASRTLIISNIDMLIINEIWEYCLNLANRSADPIKYNYIINLIPYKLVFASRLLDYGLHNMFSHYLESIKNALARAQANKAYLDIDQYYDWETIERSVENLSKIWEVLRVGLDPQSSPEEINTSYIPSMLPTTGNPRSSQLPNVPIHAPQTIQQPIPVASYDTTANFTNYATQQVPQHPHLNPRQQVATNHYSQMVNHQHQAMPPTQVHDYAPPRSDHIDSGSQQDRSIPYVGDGSTPLFQQNPLPMYRAPSYSIPSGFANPQPPIQEEINDFNIDPEPISESQDNEYGQQQSSNSYNDYSNEPSRRTSVDVPAYIPNTYGQSSAPAPPPPLTDKSGPSMNKQMASSSPVNRSRNVEPAMADSFNAFSPINEYDDLPRRDISANESQSQRVRGQPQYGNSTSVSDFGGPGNSGNMSRPSTESLNNNPSRDTQSNTAGGEGQQQSSGGGDPQKAGLLANLAGSVRGLLPKSNSKQMILPDDSSKTIIYDNERQTWIDTTKGDDEQQNDFSEPPPVMPPNRQQPTSYSLGAKSIKNRYPARP